MLLPEDFQEVVGTLSPKDKPDFALEAEDPIAGGVTYVFIPSAGKLHHSHHSQSTSFHSIFFGQLGLSFARCVCTHLYGTCFRQADCQARDSSVRT